ncbi:hypothetical protein CDN99_15135 [Roseateles aquatilis]|uniref:PABS domain-containing protein n=2 Tax=Roseateles aquatilis TaxID=431061 RepID=A0A246J8E3_9BURK|nr:hypothetical protein CDN99_15135 [Roseateles aquatilis]
MVASGFAGLGYQVVWTQQSALWLGFEAAAVLAVVTAFFGGLALGALVLGGRVERSVSPRRWYVGCELAIGAWGLALVVLMRPAGDLVQHWIGAEPSSWWQWTVSFGASFVLLLPATAAMGATLPAIERLAFMAGTQGGIGDATARRSIAGLYAANTLGAVLGVLLVTFWLVPALGLARTAGVCAALNALCAIGALWRMPAEAAPEDARGEPSSSPASIAPSPSPSPSRPASTSASTSTSTWWWFTGISTLPRTMLMPLALSGLLGIGYEVMVVRVLSQLNEDTVYTFALLLAVYLVGTSLGAAVYQRWLLGREEARLDARLPAALGVACLLGLIALWSAQALKAGAFAWFGEGFAAALGVESLLALAAFGLPTLVMGAWFSHLSAQAHRHGIGFGRALAVNTLGAAVAPVLFGVVLAPWLGPKTVLLLIVGGYLMSSTLSDMGASSVPNASGASGASSAPTGSTAFGDRRARGGQGGTSSPASWRRPWLWIPMASLALLGWLGAPLAFVDLPEGTHLVSHAEGSMAAVSVVQDGQGVARLRINNRQQEGSSASLFVDGRQALLPLLLHPGPRRVLFLGLGTGATSATAAQDPTLQVDAVELLPEVIAASPRFTDALGLNASSLRLVAADARRYVRAAPTRYDVIVSDNFHPARSGSGALYTREHFEAVRERLAAGGLFCQWLPLHQLDLDSLRSVVRAFLVAYPDGMAILASNSLETPVIGLVGHRDPEHLSDAGLARWHERLMRVPARRDGRGLADFGIEDEFALLGSVIAGPGALAAFAGDAPVNTDDRPVVAYLAPRLVYAPDSTPKDRLFEVLHRVSVRPEEVLGTKVPDDNLRLSAYWLARDHYIEAGRSVRPVADPGAMLALVGAPLLAALRTSPDFRPAYDPLLRMAVALSSRDAATARSVLTALRDAQPARREAAEALRAMEQ